MRSRYVSSDGVVGWGAAGGLARLLVPLLVWVGAASAEQVVVLEADRDNTLFEPIEGGDKSGGASADLYLKGPQDQVPYPELRRFVVHFDVEGNVPPDSTILSATLTLILNKSNFVPQEPPPVTLHRVTSDWGEGSSIAFDGIGGEPTTGDATWHHTFHPDQFWSSPGGDYVLTPSATILVGNDFGPHTVGSTPALVSDVQGWLDSGDNFGWVVATDAVDCGLRFDSRESEFAEGPTLTLTLPEPGVSTLGAAALAVIAALAARRRRYSSQASSSAAPSASTAPATQ